VEATYKKLCNLNDLEENKAFEVEVDGKSILVTKMNGEFYAIENNCTHENLTMTHGQIHNGEIQCPRHGARFDIKTGKATQLPGVMELKTFKVKVENENVMAAV